MIPVILGGLAAALFSSTFVLNAMVATHGGHWYWAGALRYVWTAVLMGTYVALRHGRLGFRGLIRIAAGDWRLLTAATATGVLAFYAPLCYSGAHAPAWIVACTWQTTVLFSPLVLMLGFRYSISARVLVWAAVALGGVVLANWQFEAVGITGKSNGCIGVMLVLVAAVAYPVGNQLLYEATKGTIGKVTWSETIAAWAYARVLLVSVWSLPGWLLLGIVVRPPPPVLPDVWRTLLVAVLSGVFATTLFYAARSRAGKGSMIAAVDATQAMEVVFAAAGDSVILGNSLPGFWGSMGAIVTCAGVVGAATVARR